MKTIYSKYWEGTLNNNCPECYANDGLKLSFSQPHEEGKLYKRSLADIKTDLQCTKCNTPIYPARWTEDIERVYNYNRKLAGEPKKYFRLKPLGIVLILGVAIAAAVAAFLIMKLSA